MPGSLDEKEPAEAKSQGFEVQITNEMLVPVYDFHHQAHFPSSCVASSLLGVHTQCSMATSIPMDRHMQQHSQNFLVFSMSQQVMDLAVSSTSH